MQTLILILVSVIFFCLGYLLRVWYAKKRKSSFEMLAKRILQDAEKKSEEIISEAKATAAKYKKEAESEIYTKRKEIEFSEKKIASNLAEIERKNQILIRREEELEKKYQLLRNKEKMLDEEREKLKRLQEEQRALLDKISTTEKQEARDLLIKTLQESLKQEEAEFIHKFEQEMKSIAEEKAKEILATTIQRYAPKVVQDLTVVSIPLPNDEIKGRIIGREGRNIRTFEQLLGVDVIIDDTPETIFISCTDPVRREIAKLALERLILDMRIQPARIEEVVHQVEAEFETIVTKIGEETAMELGVKNLPDKVLNLLGKLKFRSSYGQNQLQHTIDVAYFSEMIANELNADANICKRIAIYHDLGKVLDQTQEGAHHELSAKIARQFNEPENIINAILTHHEGYDRPKSIEAFIVAAADAISASRPGARKEMLESYVKRIDTLEKIATSFRGVVSAYAVQAGREVRVLVQPEIIDDAALSVLARDIAKKIQKEVNYPGQIKVCVIRETRATEYTR